MKIISEYDIEQIKPQTPQSAEYLEITKKFRQMSATFEGAIDCVIGTLKTIEQEMIESGLRIPIHSVTSRIKSPDSTRQKLARHGLPYTIDNVMSNLNDIAGVRIICKYITDIYHVRDLLLKSDRYTFIKEKDYIKTPKPSGYRSLHLIVETYVSVDGENRKIRCEIQLRTSAMDSWASLEHNMRYKSDLPENEQINESLKSCAEALHNTDLEMQRIALQLGIIS
ncbi:MAG: GTP pyrophosphokinase family protein [Clostridia bacterium]|nr:GTP pyrophosphokinase family protein [Clostridia bacterium]